MGWKTPAGMILLALGLTGFTWMRPDNYPIVKAGVWFHQPCRNYVTFRSVQPRNAPAWGRMLAAYTDAPKVVRFGSELLAVGALVKHLDDTQRNVCDAIEREAFPTGPAKTLGEVEDPRAQLGIDAYSLATATYKDARDIARQLNDAQRLEDARVLTDRAYCRAEAIGTPGLDTLPWWKDVLARRKDMLAATGIAVETLADGRLALPLQHAYFETGDATLDAAAIAELKRLAPFVTQVPSIRLRVEGHTDPRVVLPDLPWADNVALGQARAEAAAQVLIAAGVPEDRVEVVSRAAEEAPANGENPRRVRLVVRACEG
ncbi:MAG: OmpA family protein [Myxococcota bacterium]